MKTTDVKSLLAMVIMFLQKDFDDAEIQAMFADVLDELIEEEPECECECHE